MLKQSVSQKKITIGMPEMISRVGARAVSGWLPTDIEGLKSWWDFSDSTKIFIDSVGGTPVSSDGDVVGAVEDKSSLSNDINQAVTSAKPLYKTGVQNGLSAGFFTNPGDYLSGISSLIANKSAWAVIAVALTHDSNQGPIWVEGLSTNATPFLQTTINTTQQIIVVDRDATATGLVKTTSNVTFSAPTIFVYTKDTLTTFKIYKNGAESVSDRASFTAPAAYSVNRFTLGARIRDTLDQSYGGYIGEVFLVDESVLSDIDNIFTYLNDKWAVY